MKKNELIGMVVAAILMCTNFTSCSKDDNNESEEDSIAKNVFGVIINQKKLVELKLKWTESSDSKFYEGTKIYSFIYDNNGNLSRHEYKYKSNVEEFSETHTYSWNEKTMSIKENIEYTNKNVFFYYENDYTIDDGLIKELVEYEIISESDESKSKSKDLQRYYSYNSSKKIVEKQNSYNYSQYNTIYSWEGEKLIEEKEEEGSIIDRYSYSEKTSKGYFPFLFNKETGLFIVHPELSGMRTNQLPDKSTKYKNEEVRSKTTYSYTFDKNGYPESCTVTAVSPDGKIELYVNTITFKWQ